MHQNILMNEKEFEISYYKPGTLERSKLIYVIIGAHSDGKWLFVRHKDRQTWELPAGHIEKDESPDEAALRELYEETGSSNAFLEPLFDYTIRTNGRTGSGRLYYGKVIERRELPESEIAEIRIAEESPQPATYPDAHRSFLEVLEKHHRNVLRRNDISGRSAPWK